VVGSDVLIDQLDEIYDARSKRIQIHRVLPSDPGLGSSMLFVISFQYYFIALDAA
jgi:hypothetical protein